MSKSQVFAHSLLCALRKGFLPLAVACAALLLTPAQAAPIDSNDIEVTQQTVTNTYHSSNASNVVVHCSAWESHIANTKQILYVRYTASGTMVDNTAITSVSLVKEGTSKNCLYDGDDTVVATGAFSADNGTVAFSLGTPVDVPGGAASTQRLLLMYTMSGTATANQTFSARLDTATTADVQVQHFGGCCGAVDVLGSFPVNGAVHTVKGGLTMAAGTQNPAAGNKRIGVTNEAVMQFTLTATSAENVTLQTVSLTPVSDTLNDNANITSVRIYRDTASPLGEVSGSDPLVSTAATYSADNTKTTFDINPDYTITAGSTETFLVAYTIAASATAGMSFSTAIASGSVDIAAVGATTAQAIAPTGALTSSVHTATGALTVNHAATNPAAQYVRATSGSILMQAMTLQETTGEEDIILNSITLTPSGTGPDTVTGITGVQFCLDDNQDGDCADIGSDYVVASSPATFATDNTAQTFNFTGLPQISASATTDLLVYYSFSATVTGGMTFRSSLSQSSNFSITGETSSATLTPLAVATTDFSYMGSLATVLGGVTVTEGAQAPSAPFGVYLGQADAVLRQINLAAGAEEAIEVEAIKLSPSGTGNDASEISAVRFYLDVGSTPGSVDGTDTLLTSTPTTFATNDSAQNFSFSGTLPSVPANGSRQILVVYTVSGAATPAGDTWSAGISASADIAYRGATSLISFTSATAANNVSHTLSNPHPAKLAGRLDLTQVTVPAVSLPASALSMSVISFTLGADALENVSFNAFKIGSSSTGGGLLTTHINEVTLYEDVNSDGIVNAGDTQLLPISAPQTYNGTTPLYYKLQSPQTINASSSRKYLVTYNMGAAPGANGSTYVATLYPALMELSGSTSLGAATVSGSNLTSPTHQVYGSVTAATNQSLATVSGSTVAVVNGGATQAIQRLQITMAAAEEGRLQSIKVRPSGGANDASNVTAVKFYLDVGTDAGRVDSGDTALPTSNTVFTGDNTATTFNFSSPVALASGATTNLLMAYDVSAATSTALAAFQGNIDVPGTDLVITGANSGVRLIPLATSAPSNTAQSGDSLAAIPAVTVATASGNPAATGIIENAANQVVMMFTVTGGTGSTTQVTDIGITPSGSTNDTTHVTRVEFWEDADSSGTFSATLDTLLNTTYNTFSANDTYNNFQLNTPITLTTGQTKNVFVVYRIAAAPTSQPGTTLVAAMPSGTARTTPTVSWQESAITGGRTADWPLGSATGSTHKVTGRYTVTGGTPVSTTPTVSASNANVNMAYFTITPNGEDFNNVTFALTPSGTGNDQFDISAVKVCVDTLAKNCNDDASNLCTLNASGYTADNTVRSFTITGGAGQCAGNLTQARTYAIDYGLAGSASATETFAMALTSVTATGVSSSQSVLTNSYTVTTATATVAGSVAVASGSANPAAGFAVWNDSAMELMQLAITPGSEENMLLKQVLLDPRPTTGAGGLVNDATEITAVKFYIDSGSTAGVVDGGDTLITSSPATFAANDTPLSFSLNGGTGVTIPAGATTNLLIAYQLSAAGASAGKDAGGEITQLDDLLFTGASSAQNYVPTGSAPFTAGAKNVVGAATLALGSQNPAAQSVGTNVSASFLQFSITTDAFQTMSLTKVTITPGGTGNDQTGLLSPSLYLDNDSSGTLTSGDCLIYQKTTGYTADNTATQLDLSTTADTCRQITAGSTKNFILMVETSATASAGQTFNARIAALTDVELSSSTVTTLNPTGTLPVGNDVVVNGTLNVTTTTSMPGPTGVYADATAVPVFRFKVAALTENTRVDRVDLRDVGGSSLNDNTAISAVRFYDDSGSTPGAVDSGDTLLSTSPTNFLTDITSTTEQQFTINGGLTVNSGQSKDVLVVVDFNGNVSPSATLQYQVNAPASDVSAFGLSTSTTITPSGSQVAGNIITIKGKLFLTLSPDTPPAQGIRANSSDQPIVAFDLTAEGEDAVLQEVRIKPSGSGNDATQVLNLKFYFDTGVKGIVDGETAIVTSSTTIYPADDTGIAVTLAGTAGSRTITAGTTKTLLVTYDMGTPITPGSSFRGQLTQSTDIRASGGLSAQTIYVDTTATGNLQTVAGNLAVETSAIVGNGAIVPGQANQPVAVFKLSTDTAENVNLNSLRITPSGTGNDATNVTAVKFWVDNDQSGTVSGGDTQLDATPTVFGGDNTATTFTFNSPLTLAAGTFSNKYVLVTYDVSGATIGGNTFIATVPSLGAVGTGGTSTVTIRSTAQATGPNRVATGTFMASMASVTPATGGVDLSDSEAEILAIDLTAGPNSGIYLNYLTLTPEGSLNDLTGLTSVKFYWDQNTAGVVDGEAALGSTPTVFTADNTATQFDFATQNASASILVPAGQTRRLLVVYDFVDGTAAGLTARLSVASASAVSASEQVSFLSVSPTLGGAITGNYQTTRNGASVAAGVFNPISANIRGSAQNTPMLQLSITNGPNESSTLYGITLTPVGNADDRADVTQVKLYRDTGSTAGQVDSTDTAVTLNTAKFSSDETATTFLVAGTETITANTIQNYLVVYDMANTASTGETLRVNLSTSADLQLRGVTSNQIFGASGGTVNGNVQTIRGGLTYQAGLNNPPARATSNAADNVPVVQLRLTADSSAGIRVESVALTPASPNGCAGTQFDDSADITLVRFYDDADGDGAVDAGETEHTASPAAYTTDGTQQIFTLNTPMDVVAGTTKNMLVAYNLGGSAAACEAFSASATLSTSIVAKDITGGLSAAIVSGSASGNTQTVGGVVTLARGANSPASTSGVRKNQEAAPILEFTLLADSAEAVQLEAFTITPAGTANDVSDLTTSAAADVVVYYDADADGQVDAGTSEWPLAMSPTGFTTDNTARLFTLTTAFVISASQTAAFLVTYNVGSSAVTGTTFQASLSGSGSVQVRGVSSSALINATGTAAGSALTVTGPLTAAVGASTPGPRAINPTTQGVPMLQFTLTPGSEENVKFGSIALTPNGTGQDNTDIDKIHLYNDVNADAKVDAGDVELSLSGSTIFSANNTKTTFTLTAPLELAAATTTTFLVTADLDTAGGAITGETFAIGVSVSADISVSGVVSQQSIPVTLNPTTGLVGNPIQIGGDLVVALGPANPAAVGVAPGASQQPMLQLVFSAGTSEGVDITSIALTPAGSGDERSQNATVDGRVSKVRFFVDADSDGVVDSGETEIIPNTTPSVFSSDTVKQVFTLPTGAGRRVTAGQTKTILVAYDLTAYTNSANVAPLQETLKVTMDPATDITATGATSGSPIAATGSLVSSSTMTFAGALAVALDAATPAAANIATGAIDQPVMRFNLQALSETVTLKTITLTGAGTVDENTVINDLKLYRDNGTTAGSVDSGDTLVGSATGGPFTANNGATTITLTGGGLAMSVTASPVTGSFSTSESFLLTVSLTGTETAGQTVAFTLTGAGSATGLGGLTSQTIRLPNTTAVASSNFTVVGALAVAKGTSTPASTIAKSQATAPVLQFTLSAGAAEDVRLDSVTLTPSGLGNDAADIDAVKFYVDANANGFVDTGDTLLSTTPAKYTTDEVATTFSFVGGHTITKATNKNLLVAYQTNANPAAGASYKASIASAAAVTATGVTSGAAAQISGSAVGNTLFLDATSPTLATTDPAKASDGLTKLDALDDDDTVRFTFTDTMRAVAVDATNVNSVLALSGNHSWLSGGTNGAITSANWVSGTVLEIKLKSNATQPATVAIGDTVTLSSGFFVDAAGNQLAGTAATITGNFDQKTPDLLAAPNGVVLNSLGEVDVKFSEALDSVTAQTAANFTIAAKSGTTDTVTVTGATLQTDQTTVRVRFTGMTAKSGAVYTLTVKNVKDKAVDTPNAISTTGVSQDFGQTSTGLYTKLVVVPPGMTFNPQAASPSAPTGTPTQPVVGVAYAVKLYATDDNFKLVPGITNNVKLVLSPVTVLDGNNQPVAVNMSTGEATVNLLFDAAGAFTLTAADNNNAQAVIVAPDASKWASGATGNLANATKLFQGLQLTETGGLGQQKVIINNQPVTVVQYDDTDAAVTATQLPANGSTASNVVVSLVDDTGVPIQNTQVRLVINDQIPTGRVAQGAEDFARTTQADAPRSVSSVTVGLPSINNAVLSSDAQGKAAFGLTSTQGGAYAVQVQARNSSGNFANVGNAFSLVYRAASVSGSQDTLNQTVSGDVFNVNGTLQIISRVGDPTGIDTTGAGTFVVTHNGAIVAATVSCTPAGTLASPVQVETLCVFTLATPAGGWPAGPNTFQLTYVDVNGASGSGIGSRASASPQSFVLNGQAGFALSNVMNVPNPFNPTDRTTNTNACTMSGTSAATLRCTDLTFQASEDVASVTVTIYNSLGRPVKTIRYNDTGNIAGVGFNNAVQWDGTDNAGGLVARGIYYYELRAVATSGAVSSASGKIAVVR